MSQHDADATNASVKKHATAAITAIFQLYLKEETDAFSRVEAIFDAAKPGAVTSNFTRRLGNGAAFTAAVTKIVSYCRDNQIEALETKTRINAARVEALQAYRDALKAKVDQMEGEKKRYKFQMDDDSP